MSRQAQYSLCVPRKKEAKLKRQLCMRITSSIYKSARINQCEKGCVWSSAHKHKHIHSQFYMGKVWYATPSERQVIFPVQIHALSFFVYFVFATHTHTHTQTHTHTHRQTQPHTCQAVLGTRDMWPNSLIPWGTPRLDLSVRYNRWRLASLMNSS